MILFLNVEKVALKRFYPVALLLLEPGEVSLQAVTFLGDQSQGFLKGLNLVLVLTLVLPGENKV